MADTHLALGGHLHSLGGGAHQALGGGAFTSLWGHPRCTGDTHLPPPSAPPVLAPLFELTNPFCQGLLNLSTAPLSCKEAFHLGETPHPLGYGVTPHQALVTPAQPMGMGPPGHGDTFTAYG